MALIEHRPTGLLKHLLRTPIWFYRAGLGRLLGHRFVYIAHRGRRTGARREVVLEVVGYTARIPEVVVIAAWGKNPDWYRNLQAAPALELRIAAQRWDRPEHRFLDDADTLRVLHSYQQAHPGAWKRIAPLIGLPAEPDEASLRAVHGVAFTPHPMTDER